MAVISEFMGSYSHRYDKASGICSGRLGMSEVVRGAVWNLMQQRGENPPFAHAHGNRRQGLSAGGVQLRQNYPAL